MLQTDKTWRLKHEECTNDPPWHQDFPTQPQAEERRAGLAGGTCPGCGNATPDQNHYTVRQVTD